MHYTSYSDRLASSFRSALDLQICSSGRNFHFPRGPISQQTLCCVGSTQFQPKPKQLYKSLGLSSGAALVGFAFGVTELISIYLHLCAMCSVSVSFFPVRAATEMRLSVIKRCVSRRVHNRERRQAVQFAARSSVSRRPLNRHANKARRVYAVSVGLRGILRCI